MITGSIQLCSNVNLKHCSSKVFLFNNHFFVITTGIEHSLENTDRSILIIHKFSEDTKELHRINCAQLSNLASTQCSKGHNNYVVYDHSVYYFKIDNTKLAYDEDYTVSYRLCQFDFEKQKETVVEKWERQEKWPAVFVVFADQEIKMPKKMSKEDEQENNIILNGLKKQILSKIQGHLLDFNRS